MNDFNCNFTLRTRCDYATPCDFCRASKPCEFRDFDQAELLMLFRCLCRESEKKNVCDCNMDGGKF